MSTIAPVRQHPLYWVATSLLGYSPGRLARALKTNSHIVARWAFGHNPPPHLLASLQALIRRDIESPEYNNAAPREVKSDTHRLWMKTTFRLIDEYMTDSLPPHQRPRISTLQREIIALLPARRSYVLAQLQARHSLRAIKRAAHTLGVLEEPHPVTSELIWRQRGQEPASIPKAKMEPTFVPPRSKRAEELQTLITVYMGRRIDRGQESVLASRLVAHCHAKGHSLPAIYRAIKDLCLLRHSSGFGKDKVTRYALPHDKGDDNASS